MTDFTRREFLKFGTGACLTIGTSCVLGGCGNENKTGTGHGDAGDPEVHLILGDTLSDLYRMGREAVHALGIRPGKSLLNRSVFIKPNLMTLGLGYPFDPNLGESTKAEIVVGIAEHCLQAGAARVTIGDGAQALSWDWNSVVFFKGNTLFGTGNLADAVERLKTEYPSQELELVCLNEADQWETIPSSSNHDIMQQGLPVSRSFFEADHVISVALLKTHLFADISGSMKNLVGVTSSLPPFGINVARTGIHLAYAGATCGGFENAGISACATDILKWRKAAGKKDFAVIEGSIGLEATGPTTIFNLGKPIDIRERSPAGKYFVLASSDFLAADATAARIMNHDSDNLKQMRMAENRGLGTLHNIRLVGEATLEQLRIEDFEKAEQAQPEWGASAFIPESLNGPASNRNAKKINTLAGLSLPAGAVYLLKKRFGPIHGAGDAMKQGTN